MKNLFRGYYKLTDREIQNIWSNGFISVDTNVLFNIYRYSEDTRKELIKVLIKYSDKLWLTNHSAYEFHKNRIAVINDQIKVYDETIKAFEKLENDIIKNLKTPHLSQNILIDFKKTIKATIKDLEKKRTFYKNLLIKDPILSHITSIFRNKVGVGFSSEEISKIEKEGEDRYKRKIPPGFKDNDKSENKFGDLIIWKELIQKSRTDNRPFILIIDDRKEDWLLKAQGETISPRQELSQELFKDANQFFYLYTSDRFLEFSSKTGRVKKTAIDEVREIGLEKNEPIVIRPMDWNLPTGMIDTYKLHDWARVNTFQDYIKNPSFQTLGNSLSGIDPKALQNYLSNKPISTLARLVTVDDEENNIVDDKSK